MKRDEQITLLTALDVAIAKCHEQAEKADTYDEQQYQWGQADGLYIASMLIAGRTD